MKIVPEYILKEILDLTFKKWICKIITVFQIGRYGHLHKFLHSPIYEEISFAES